MTVVEDQVPQGSLLADLFTEDTFRPAEPRSIEDTGLTPSIIEALICKYVMQIGSASGREIAKHICLPFGVVEELFQSLRTRQLLVHCAAAQLNDYVYTLTEQGREYTRREVQTCSYGGPAPVPLDDYLMSVDAQTIRAEAPRRAELEKAFEGLSVEPHLYDGLGPAVNSGAGLFLYGAPGNGKTTLAKQVTMCFGQDVWLPHVLIVDGQFIKLFDAAYHEPREESDGSLLKTAEHDRRWIKVGRPTVVVGGELTMDGLEIRHDPHSNISEAPLQLKSNCGCLLIDDFGRQRMEPTELLNRWIVPLENRYDFLTLSTGKKIQVPFEQLIIFSTNLEPHDLADDAFLRRIPYKIEIGDPTEEEFHRLFEMVAEQFDCSYRSDAVDFLIDKYYRGCNRPLRRCHPRDLMVQTRNYCAYNDSSMEMSEDIFSRVAASYFTAVAGA